MYSKTYSNAVKIQPSNKFQDYTTLNEFDAPICPSEVILRMRNPASQPKVAYNFKGSAGEKADGAIVFLVACRVAVMLHALEQYHSMSHLYMVPFTKATCQVLQMRHQHMLYKSATSMLSCNLAGIN